MPVQIRAISFSGLARPLRGFDGTFGDARIKDMHGAEVELTDWVALLGSFPRPFGTSPAQTAQCCGCEADVPPSKAFSHAR